LSRTGFLDARDAGNFHVVSVETSAYTGSDLGEFHRQLRLV
jgi:hypothetical protein